MNEVVVSDLHMELRASYLSKQQMRDEFLSATSEMSRLGADFLKHYLSAMERVPELGFALTA